MGGMDPYREFVLSEIIEHPEINSAIIYDHLLETFRDFAPSKRTVRLYVCNLREAEGIPRIIEDTAIRRKSGVAIWFSSAGRPRTETYEGRQWKKCPGIHFRDGIKLFAAQIRVFPVRTIYGADVLRSARPGIQMLWRKAGRDRV